MNIPASIASFWHKFQESINDDTSDRFYEAFHFDDNEVHANDLAQLVLAGRKRATASLLWTYEIQDKPLPFSGALSVVTDWHGTPLCVIESTAVDTVPFNQVTAEFAAIEGEGDQSLEFWRNVHWQYFSRECERLNKQPTQEMPVLCEQFEVVYRATQQG